jgi:hypothetical protein
LSSTTSSSHASSLENFRENISRGYSTWILDVERIKWKNVFMPLTKCLVNILCQLQTLHCIKIRTKYITIP